MSTFTNNGFTQDVHPQVIWGSTEISLTNKIISFLRDLQSRGSQYITQKQDESLRPPKRLAIGPSVSTSSHQSTTEV